MATAELSSLVRPQPSSTLTTDGHGDAAASSPNKCNTNFDAVAVLRGEMWVFKSKFFWRINKDGGSREDPMELRSFWYGLPSDVDHIDAVYEKSDHDIVFFVGKKYYILASNSYLRYGPLPITVSQRKRSRSAIRLNYHYLSLSLQKLGLPESLDKIDGAMRWGYNDKTYFFSGGMMMGKTEVLTCTSF